MDKSSKKRYTYKKKKTEVIVMSATTPQPLTKRNTRSAQTVEKKKVSLREKSQKYGDLTVSGVSLVDMYKQSR
jgi:hypothetical protein